MGLDARKLGFGAFVFLGLMILIFLTLILILSLEEHNQQGFQPAYTTTAAVRLENNMQTFSLFEQEQPETMFEHWEKYELKRASQAEFDMHQRLLEKKKDDRKDRERRERRYGRHYHGIDQHEIERDE